MNSSKTTGAAMTIAAGTGTVTINGVTTATITLGGTDAAADRASVIAAINAKTGQTGITATDGGSSANGVQLVAADRSTVTIEGVNAAKVAGMFVVSLGCSTEPYTGSGFHISRHLAPTAGLRARPASSILRPGVSSVTSDDPCVTFNVPACQSQKQITFYVGPWESTTKSFQCKAPYLYAWSFTWAQSGSPSVSALGGVAAVNPGTTNILLTNWNPFYTDLVEVNVACSQNNSFGGSCGAPQRDPGCPIVANSQKNHCNTGPVPVCFQNYEERCAPNNQLYRCTIDLGLSWCSPCPG